MKQYRFKIFIVVLFVIVAIYYLLPTYYDYQNSNELAKSLEQIKSEIKEKNPDISKKELEEILAAKEDSIIAENPSYRQNREDRIKLGLDLQGGMYLQLEVNTARLLENLAKDPDTQFAEILAIAEEKAKQTDEDLVSILITELKNRNIRISRYFGDIRQEESEIIDELKSQEEDAVSRALQVINNRVNQYGVSEPNIQKQGARRIVVELPGVAKEEEAKRLLQGRALLEFRLVKPAEFSVPLMNKIDEVLSGTSVADSLATTDIVKSADTTVKSDTSLIDDKPVDQMDPEEFARKHPFFSLAIVNPQSPFADAYVKDTDRDRLLRLLDRPEVKKIFPDDVEFLFGFEPITDDQGNTYHMMYLVNKTPELTGGVIENAQATIDPQSNENIVTMQMNSEGATEWARITGSNIDQRCAIVLDGAVYSAPKIINKITGGNSQITGMGSAEESKLLEIVLKAGALPAPIDILEERTVGPSLGQDSINSGLMSTLIGFALVAIFMIAYYKKTGVVADLALMFTVLFVFGILAAFKATLTMPGIAGIILTIGMAVDANVIIFERIREELTTGKTVKAAVDSGFKNSYSAIFDANITTFFTGVILYQFGSGPIQGFALTLMIGIVCSMVSALIISRLVIDLMTSKGQKLEIGWRT
ncbi:MAG: protein translocase subunit SecD, partial [Ignavibacteriales bacterium]|nr:protein translocase subunit SecD [Ignavibacteriales bacterium]